MIVYLFVHRRGKQRSRNTLAAQYGHYRDQGSVIAPPRFNEISAAIRDLPVRMTQVSLRVVYLDRVEEGSTQPLRQLLLVGFSPRGRRLHLGGRLRRFSFWGCERVDLTL